MLGLALGLGSSLCWGCSDYVGGLQARRRPLLAVLLVSQAAGLVLVVAFVAARGQGPPPFDRLGPAIAAGAGGMIALAAFYRALAIGTMSIVAPISATGVVVPVLAGIAGGDRPSALQVAGIGAAVAGVALASREQGPGHAAGAAAANRGSIGLALVAALGFGAFFVGLRSSARYDVPWSLLVSRGAGVVLLSAAALVSRPSLPRGGRAWTPLAAIGLLDVGANALYAMATRHGLLSVVAVASSLYPLATVALARVLLGERVRRVQELGVAAALAGVVLIAAG